MVRGPRSALQGLERELELLRLVDLGVLLLRVLFPEQEEEKEEENEGGWSGRRDAAEGDHTAEFVRWRLRTEGHGTHREALEVLDRRLEPDLAVWNHHRLVRDPLLRRRRTDGGGTGRRRSAGRKEQWLQGDEMRGEERSGGGGGVGVTTPTAPDVVDVRPAGAHVLHSLVVLHLLLLVHRELLPQLLTTPVFTFTCSSSPSPSCSLLTSIAQSVPAPFEHDGAPHPMERILLFSSLFLRSWELGELWTTKLRWRKAEKGMSEAERPQGGGGGPRIAAGARRSRSAAGSEADRSRSRPASRSGHHRREAEGGLGWEGRGRGAPPSKSGRGEVLPGQDPIPEVPRPAVLHRIRHCHAQNRACCENGITPYAPKMEATLASSHNDWSKVGRP